MLPNTPETKELAIKCEIDRLRRQQAVKELAVLYEVPSCNPLHGTDMLDDGEGNHYEVSDIGRAVLRYHFNKLG
jgi:hypothetical protein